MLTYQQAIFGDALTPYSSDAHYLFLHGSISLVALPCLVQKLLRQKSWAQDPPSLVPLLARPSQVLPHPQVLSCRYKFPSPAKPIAFSSPSFPVQEFTDRQSHLSPFSFYETSSSYKALSSTQMLLIPKGLSSSDLLPDLQTLSFLNIPFYVSSKCSTCCMSKQKSELLPQTCFFRVFPFQ